MSFKLERELYSHLLDGMIERQCARLTRDHNNPNAGYAYTTGYLHSLVVSMLLKMPAESRDTYLQQIMEAK